MPKRAPAWKQWQEREKERERERTKMGATLYRQPSFSFGSAPRCTVASEMKVYLGDAVHHLAARGSHTPAPSRYNVAPMLGPRQATRHNTPAYGFSRAPRAHEGELGQRAQTPGPGTYGALKVSGPRQSTRPSSASYGFGTMGRPGLHDTRNTPGPGAYRLEGALGEQIRSPKPTEAAWHFGKEDKRRFYLQQERLQASTPGPGTYDP